MVQDTVHTMITMMMVVVVALTMMMTTVPVTDVAMKDSALHGLITALTTQLATERQVLTHTLLIPIPTISTLLYKNIM